MVAGQLYQRLRERGLLVTTDDGQHVTVSPARLLTDTDRKQIRQNKDGLLQFLAAQGGQSDERERTLELARFRLGDEEIAACRYEPRQGRVFEGLYALDCETEPIQEPHVPRLALVSVSDGTTHYLVHPDDLAAFLVAHAGLPVAFHNVGFDFWVVHEHLVQGQQQKAAAVWMDLLRERRLHDTMLLDMLVRLADGADKRACMQRDLGVLAGEYGDITLDKDNPYRLRFGELIGADWNVVDKGFFAYALPDAIATARVYPELHRRAYRLMEDYGFRPPVTRSFVSGVDEKVGPPAAEVPEVTEAEAPVKFDIDPAAIDKFGVLTELIQVGAAVALAQIKRNGMHTDQKRLAKTATEHRRRLAVLTGKLNRKYPGLFKLDAKGELKRTAKTGAPSKSTKVLDEYLLRAVREIEAKTGQAIDIPRTATGQISKAFDDWESLMGRHPFLDTWWRYEKAMKLCQFLGNLDVSVIRPHYSVSCRTGRTTCSNPNVQQIPRGDDFREVIVPVPDYFLLAVDYCFVELVTLAAVCQCRFGFSKLADVIRDGVDPHCHTAGMLLDMPYQEFMELKKNEPEKFKRWRQAAKGVNFGVPGGLGAAALVDYARRTYEVEMSLEESQQFRQRLVEDVYPELKLFLADTSLEVLADNLGATLDDVQAAIGAIGADKSCIAGSIRKIAEGRPVKQDGTPYSEYYVERVWDALNELNRRSDLRSLLSLRVGSEELADRLFFTSVATITGRIRAGVPYTAERNTQFQGLAADGAKIALTNLVVASFRVVGFVHDEILIELPDEGGYVCRKTVDEAITIIRRSMEEVTYGIPVGCEYTLSTCWSKRAELIERGDRIYPWSPP